MICSDLLQKLILTIADLANLHFLFRTNWDHSKQMLDCVKTHWVIYKPDDADRNSTGTSAWLVVRQNLSGFQHHA